MTDWQIPHRDRELWHSSSEKKGGRGDGKEKESVPFLFQSLGKRQRLGESSTGEDELPFPCAVRDGWQTVGKQRRKWEKQCGRGKGERGGNFSVCVFPSKAFWQGRAHCVARRGGAILKSPTGTLRDAGSQNRYISGLLGFFYFFPLLLLPYFSLLLFDSQQPKCRAGAFFFPAEAVGQCTHTLWRCS